MAAGADYLGRTGQQSHRLETVPVKVGHAIDEVDDDVLVDGEQGAAVGLRLERLFRTLAAALAGDGHNLDLGRRIGGGDRFLEDTEDDTGAAARAPGDDQLGGVARQVDRRVGGLGRQTGHCSDHRYAAQQRRKNPLLIPFSPKLIFAPSRFRRCSAHAIELRATGQSPINRAERLGAPPYVATS